MVYRCCNSIHIYRIVEKKKIALFADLRTQQRIQRCNELYKLVEQKNQDYFTNK